MIPNNRVFIFTVIIAIIFNIDSIAQNNNKVISDTLRRELTVENTENISIGEIAPLPIKLDINKPIGSLFNIDYDLKSKPIYPTNTTYISYIPIENAPKFPLSKQLGYIDVSIGLPTNVRISGGLDIIKNYKHHLTGFILFNKTKYKYLLYSNKNNTISSIKGLANINYNYEINNTNIYTKLNYTTGERNYYGLYSDNGKFEYVPRYVPVRKYNYLDIKAGLNKLSIENSRWLYSINSNLSIYNSTFNTSILNNGKSKISAIGITLDAQTTYLLNADNRISIYGDISNYSYYTDSFYSNIFTNISPTYIYSSSSANFYWDIEVGLGISIDKMSKESLYLYLWPKAKIHTAWNKSTTLDISISAGDNMYTFRNIDKLQPYFYTNNNIGILRNKLISRIEISGLINENLRTSLYTELNIKDRALQFIPRKYGYGSLKPHIAAVYFESETTNYNQYIIGANLKYSYNRIFTIGADLSYSKFTNKNTSIFLTPNLKGVVNLEYSPAEKWHIQAEYQMMGGIKYPSFENKKVIKELPYWNTISTRVVYNLFTKLSLYAEIQSNFSSKGTEIYPYYPIQPSTGIIGLNLKF